MIQPKPGDHVRVWHHYLPCESVVTVEGKVIERDRLAPDNSVTIEGGISPGIEDFRHLNQYVQVTVERLVQPLDFLPLRSGDVVQVSATRYVILGDKVFFVSGEQPKSYEDADGFVAWLEEWRRGQFGHMGVRLLHRLELS
jgi:hypothetical protein